MRNDLAQFAWFGCPPLCVDARHAGFFVFTGFDISMRIQFHQSFYKSRIRYGSTAIKTPSHPADVPHQSLSVSGLSTVPLCSPPIFFHRSIPNTGDIVKQLSRILQYLPRAASLRWIAGIYLLTASRQEKSHPPQPHHRHRQQPPSCISKSPVTGRTIRNSSRTTLPPLEPQLPMHRTQPPEQPPFHVDTLCYFVLNNLPSPDPE